MCTVWGRVQTTARSQVNATDGWLYWLHMHYEVARVVPLIYTPWQYSVPTEHGGLILYASSPVLIRVGYHATKVSLHPFQPSGWLSRVPVMHIGRTGDVTPDYGAGLGWSGPVQEDGSRHRQGYSHAYGVAT